MLVLLALQLAAHGADCDADALRTSVDEATPARVATWWAKLAACDREAALATAEHTFDTALAGSDAHPAVLRAVQIGAGDHAREWLREIPSDERSKAIGYLEDYCASIDEVAPFFVETHEQLGESFWTERWHRGLAGCRTDEVRELLAESLEGDEVGRDTHDRAQFFSVLEVYARNLRGDALPKLQELATELEDEEEVTYVINAFADAAGVGSMQGIDHDVAEQAAQAIEALGPELPVRGIEQARTTLLALGADREADQYAKYRWPAAYRLNDRSYLYAVVATEKATCRNGKQKAAVHHASFTEAGDLWPEQVAELIPDKVSYEWQLDGSGLCRGEVEVSYDLPHEPFKTREDMQAWRTEHVQQARATVSGFKKVSTEKHEPFEL